ncbi:MAG: NarK/NasA family nitrate transporter [Xanthomonadaceae bacterium]|jgi:NNP family nitrate/nitrite transporter-like MFS transporter|nr:NarK/NasA family nitrate transporter [Xanthomonadaceae bacterium]
MQDNNPKTPTTGQQQRALWGSTFAFTTCFAVWMIFSIIGIPIKEKLQLSETAFGLLIAMPVLSGSLIRIFVGVWADQLGGRLILTVMMLFSAAATWMVTYATSYPQFLLAALLIGIVGGSFSVGITYVSKWFSADKQGTALGIFGAGNIGAAVTKLLAPIVMAAAGWMMVAKVWALALALVAVAFYLFTSDDPSLAERRASGVKPVPFKEQMMPLKKLQVWRFSLYYFFVFGGFVALSLWLPRYLIGAYGMDVKHAGVIAACYSIPASLFRIVGGWLSDKHGARKVMYWTLGVSVICTFLLAYPDTNYVINGIHHPISFRLAMGVIPFTGVVFVLGFFMSLGKAAVYKHIPVYYPDYVGSVGGVVGMIGGLGGFVLPIMFGALNDLTDVWTSCFMLLFLVSAGSLVWMHFAIRRMERKHFPQIAGETDLPEIMQATSDAQRKG